MIAETGWAEQAAVLDGDVTPRVGGFDATTATRTLFVPSRLAGDAAGALIICQRDGLLIEKIERMSREAAEILFATTIAEPILPS